MIIIFYLVKTTTSKPIVVVIHPGRGTKNCIWNVDANGEKKPTICVAGLSRLSFIIPALDYLVGLKVFVILHLMSRIHSHISYVDMCSCECTPVQTAADLILGDIAV